MFNREQPNFEAYPKKMLDDCLKGKPCSYGICDECPITQGYCNEDIEDLDDIEVCENN